MFNSKEFEWSNVTVLLLGRPITGIRGITYSENQEKEVVYARGNKPRAIQKGNKSYEGSISILQSELEALYQAVGTKKGLIDIPAFDVVVAYIPEGSTTIVTDIVKNCEFTKSEKSIKQGDKFMEVELPVIALDIEYNV